MKYDGFDYLRTALPMYPVAVRTLPNLKILFSGMQSAHRLATPTKRAPRRPTPARQCCPHLHQRVEGCGGGRKTGARGRNKPTRKLGALCRTTKNRKRSPLTYTHRRRPSISLYPLSIFSPATARPTPWSQSPADTSHPPSPSPPRASTTTNSKCFGRAGGLGIPGGWAPRWARP